MEGWMRITSLLHTLSFSLSPILALDMQHETAHRYVVTDEDILDGEPILAGTRTPVRAVVELWRQGVSPEEIPNRLPHLSLAQVFDALSYYSDHQEAIHEYIDRNRISEEEVHDAVRSGNSGPDK
jgi:uncharacterized protein (DUF433 family)